MIRYVFGQVNKYEESYNTEKSVVIAWRDYIIECKTLGYDLTDDRIVRPSNLFESHQKTMKLVSHKQNPDLERKISSRLGSLKGYFFENESFLIRPAEGCWELIEEGKSLEICVGSYAERYANGETIILLIRKKAAPNRPFYTVEIRKKTIIQAQGLKHQSPIKEVKEFIHEFERTILKKNKKEKAVAV
nr:PcfJ domain-containing protein [Paenibacillus roseus]